MQYDDTMKIPKFIILRLKGLNKGQFIANTNQECHAEYDFKTILYTFKICKNKIHQGFKANQTGFSNEKHKFNYAMVIIENEINDVVLRLKRVKKSKEKTEKLELDNQFNIGAEYKKRSKDISKNLKDLW